MKHYEFVPDDTIEIEPGKVLHRIDYARAIRLADEFAASLICTEGQELEPGRWKLNGDQVEYGPHLQAAFEHLKWRGFADVTPLNDGLMVVFTKP